MANQLKKGPKLPVQQLTILGENHATALPLFTSSIINN